MKKTLRWFLFAGVAASAVGLTLYFTATRVSDVGAGRHPMSLRHDNQAQLPTESAIPVERLTDAQLSARIAPFVSLSQLDEIVSMHPDIGRRKFIEHAVELMDLRSSIESLPFIVNSDVRRAAGQKLVSTLPTLIRKGTLSELIAYPIEAEIVENSEPDKLARSARMSNIERRMKDHLNATNSGPP